MTRPGLHRSQQYGYCDHVSEHSVVMCHFILFPLQLSQTTSYQGAQQFTGLSAWGTQTPAVRLGALRLAQYGCDAGSNTKPVRD